MIYLIVALLYARGERLKFKIYEEGRFKEGVLGMIIVFWV